MNAYATREMVDAAVRQLATPPSPDNRYALEDGTLKLTDRERHVLVGIEADNGSVVTVEDA